MLAPWKESYDQPREHIKKQRHHFVNKFHLVKAMVFSVVMYGCESWTMKKAECRRIDAFELWCWRRLESPLDCMEIQPVHPQGDQSWEFIGRTNVEADTPIFWPPDVKSWLIWKDPKCWERLRAGGEGNNREGSMASASQCERLLLNDKTLGFLASGEDNFNLGPETRLDRSELLCNKVLLKYKGDTESFWHRHQKGAERVHPC